ncbi:MAG: SPOR domain-containing protein [Woeseia sp.]
MRNLLLLLLLANILYFVWGLATDRPSEPGVAIVSESELGPPLTVGDVPQAATSVGAMLAEGGEATEATDVEVSEITDFTAVLGRSCVSIGPFTETSDAERVLADYRGEGMRATLRTTEGQVFVGHWVQIRDIANRTTADAMLAQLVNGGLTDAYLVPTEDEGLKISLGLFGDISRAERVELQAESLDMDADISPRMRDATVYFVDIALPPGRGAGAIIERYGEDKVLLRGAATCPRSG